MTTATTDLSKAEATIREKLAELGGGMRRDDDIVNEGRKLILPLGTTKRDAIRILHRSIEAEEEPTSFRRDYEFRPWDGARAFNLVVTKHFGMMVGVATPGGFFSPSEPPALITIKTGVGTTEQVPWGNLVIPLLPGVMVELEAYNDGEWGQLFRISATGPRKFRYELEGLFNLVQAELMTNSLYRGQAIDGHDDANFIDLTGVDPARVIYSDETMTQLNANIWSLLEYTKQQEENNLPLKRAVLLEGPFGTGKTLAAYLTAKKAVENDWTFLYCRPATDEIDVVMQTARLYQPAVVFFEDMDTISNGGASQDEVTKLLDVFDGINAKGTRIMVVLTTNHAEKIHKGMLRPGRLDAVVHIGALDRGGVERMVRAEVPSNLLYPDTDYDRVYAAMDGFMPAFVKEAIDRAKRYNIARNKGSLTMLATDDFVQSAQGLRPQLELMDGNPEHKSPDTLATAMRGVVTEASERAVREVMHPNMLKPTNGSRR